MTNDCTSRAALIPALPSEAAFHASIQSPLLAESAGACKGPGVCGSAPAAQGSDVAAILDERGARYGKFEDHAAVTQRLKTILRTHMGDRWELLSDYQKEGLEMVCHKLGRIANGDPDYADSWVDIAGYAKLVADRLEGVSR